MKVEVALGEVVDKVSILDIKRCKLKDSGALANVERERALLVAAWQAAALPPMTSLPQWTALSEVNQALWEVEDDLRASEARGDFGPSFVALARSVYRLNDRRSALKRAINLDLGSSVIEEKSYVDPRS